MYSLISKLISQGHLDCPTWVGNNIIFEGLVGSRAYGLETDDSDYDIIGICIPPKENVFPHLNGEICGFSTQTPQFKVFQKHHVKYANRVYDFKIYSIVSFFNLAMGNNPNILEALFLPPECVLFTTAISEAMYLNRRLFLHKGCWPRFKGYATSELKNAISEEGACNSKAASRVVHLLGLVEQLLNGEDLNLQKNQKNLQDIREGNCTKEQIIEFFNICIPRLDDLCKESKLPEIPDEFVILTFLQNCLDTYYAEI